MSYHRKSEKIISHEERRGLSLRAERERALLIFHSKTGFRTALTIEEAEREREIFQSLFKT